MTDIVKRRSTHVDHSVNYAAVGASQAADLMKYPPTDSTPFEDEVLLGSGEDRFVSASAALMTWSAQRGSGIDVAVINKETEAKYSHISFGKGGVPEGPKHNEQFFAPDGTPYLEAGNLVEYVFDEKHRRKMRVLTVLDEDRRVGFIVGTADEGSVLGEIFQSVNFRSDNTVWAVARGFLYDARSGGAKLVGKSPVKAEIQRIKQQLQALTPAIQATKVQQLEDEEPSSGE